MHVGRTGWNERVEYEYKFKIGQEKVGQDKRENTSKRIRQHRLGQDMITHRIGQETRIGGIGFSKKKQDTIGWAEQDRREQDRKGQEGVEK